MLGIDILRGQCVSCSSSPSVESGVARIGSAGMSTGRGVILNVGGSGSDQGCELHALMRGTTLSACQRVSDPCAAFCDHQLKQSKDRNLQWCDHYCKALAH